ncbi:MAG: hypothetical protein LBJ00_10450 [Planctomycetaceae bacterium]|nr:hypothetical protein [Planctomycetaceae bacterium]
MKRLFKGEACRPTGYGIKSFVSFVIKKLLVVGWGIVGDFPYCRLLLLLVEFHHWYLDVSCRFSAYVNRVVRR